MTWTNAFDVGACTVKVVDGGASQPAFLPSGEQQTLDVNFGDTIMYYVVAQEGSPLTVQASGENVAVFFRYGIPFVNGGDPYADADVQATGVDGVAELTANVPAGVVYIAVYVTYSGSLQVMATLGAAGTFVDPSTLFRQVMAKGDSATYTDGTLGECTVAVSADGVASLSADQVSTAGVARLLCVTPTSAPTSAARLRGITADIGQYGSLAKAYGDTSGVAIELTDAGNDTWTPDPCDLPGAIEFAVSAEVQGA